MGNIELKRKNANLSSKDLRYDWRGGSDSILSQKYLFYKFPVKAIQNNIFYVIIIFVVYY